MLDTITKLCKLPIVEEKAQPYICEAKPTKNMSKHDTDRIKN